MKDFLTLNDFSAEQLREWINLADAIKKSSHQYTNILSQKKLGLLFSQPSTRTRISFEVAMTELGGVSYYYGADQLQLSRGESLHDTAKTLSRYLDGIVIRNPNPEHLRELAKHASIPIINGLTRDEHPCQALSDMLTIKEKLGNFKKLKLCFVGDGNNVARSLMQACSKLGLHFTCVAPKQFQISTEASQELFKDSGSEIILTDDLKQGLKEADIVYTDVWTSMGWEKERENREAIFSNFSVTNQVMRLAKKSAIFMHNLPAHRGKEVTDEVIDGEQSVVWDQAENRLHLQKALLLSFLNGGVD